MIYKVQVKVMPLKNLLDPQGKAIQSGLGNLGLMNIADVRVGKHINLQIEATCDALRDKGVCPRNSRPVKPVSKK